MSASLTPEQVARLDQVSAAVGERLAAIVDRYRVNAAVHGAAPAQVDLHAVLLDTFDAGQLAALLGMAVVRLAASGGETG